MSVITVWLLFVASWVVVGLIFAYAAIEHAAAEWHNQRADILLSEGLGQTHTAFEANPPWQVRFTRWMDKNVFRKGRA